MKFSKKLVLAAILAMIGSRGIFAAKPAEVEALFAKHSAQFADINPFYVAKKAHFERAYAEMKSDLNKKINAFFANEIMFRGISASKREFADVNSDVKVACLMNLLDATFADLKKVFVSSSFVGSDIELKKIVIAQGLRGNGIYGPLLELAGEDAELQAAINAWTQFHASEFDAILSMTKEQKLAREVADAKAEVGQAKAASNHFFALFRTPAKVKDAAAKLAAAEKAAAEAKAEEKKAEEAPVEVVEPALDTVWFDSAKALVSAATVIEETRKKELDKNLLIALNAWIANPANVTAEMVAGLNAVAVMTSPSVVDYLKSLEMIIKSPVVDGINTLAAYKAYAEAQWKAGNKMAALVLITKIELDAVKAAK